MEFRCVFEIFIPSLYFWRESKEKKNTRDALNFFTILLILLKRFNFNTINIIKKILKN